MIKNFFSYLLLLILPLILVLVALYLNDVRRPFFLGKNWDPSYTYLLNMLNLARLKGVGLIEHPGTPVHSLGAIVLRAVHCLLRLFANGNLQADVLMNPELYVTVLHKVFLGLNTLMLIFLGMGAFKVTKDLMSSIMVQSSPFFSGTTLLFGLTEVRAESLLLFSSLLFIFLILNYVHTYAEKANDFPTSTILKLSPQAFFIICFSIVSGFGMATKITFFPLLVIPLLILQTYRNKIKYMLGTCLSFIFFTLPMMDRYGEFFYWLNSIFTHSGVHGMGSKKIIEVSLYLSHLKVLLTHNLLFTFILLFSLCILMMSYSVPRFRKISLGNTHFKMLTGVSISQLLGILSVAKHFSVFGMYYLLPVLCLSGVTLVLLTYCLRDIVNDLKIEEIRASIAQKIGHVFFKLNVKWVLFFFFISFLLYTGIIDIRYCYQSYTIMNKEGLKAYNKVENDYKDYAKIYTLNSSSPAFALGFSDISARKYNSKILKKLYKNAYIYYPWEGRGFKKTMGGFHDWNGSVDFEEILSKYGRKIIFQGVKIEILSANPDWNLDGLLKPGPGLLFVDVLKGNIETVYELQGSAE